MASSTRSSRARVRASGVAASSRARSGRPRARSASTMSGSRCDEPDEATFGPELREGLGPVPLPVGDQAERLAGRRNPTGSAHGGLGVRLSAIQIGVEKQGDHDEVLSHALGVLLAQGPQLGPDGPVELLAGHAVRDGRLRLAGALRGEPLPAAALRLVGAAAITSRGVGRSARAGRPPRRGVALTGRATVRPAGGPVLRAHAANLSRLVCASGHRAWDMTKRPARIREFRRGAYESMSGCVLLSHTVTSAVPSALKGLASGFGMEPGVSPSL